MAEQPLEHLNAHFAIPGQLRFIEQPAGFVVAEIETPLATAAIALQGAHLMSWQPTGQASVIWMSPEAKRAAGKSLRGGVPICWPWFGAHADALKPAHGYARTVPWHVVATTALADGTIQLVFELVATAAAAALWPHATPVRAVFTVGRALDIELVTRNEGKQSIPLGEALHTYFLVSDIENVELHGLSGRDYADKVKDFQRQVQEGPITIHSEVDRVYLNTEDSCLIVDPGLGRVIRIDKQGSRSTVVWNPWQEKAAAMGDLGEAGHRHMVCVESGNAMDNVVEIPAGGEHSMKVRYSVEGERAPE